MVSASEPGQIPGGGENVFAWSRQDIQDAFQDLDTTDGQAQSQKYASCASEWDQGLETFKRSVGASIAEAWEGASAERARSAITEYTTDAANLTDLFFNLSKDIKAAGIAIVETKHGVQPAAQHSWTTHIPLFGRAQARSEERTRAQNESDTREAMLRNYVTQFGKTDATVPVVPAALNPLNPTGATGPGGASGPSGPTGPGVSGPGVDGPTGVSGPGSTGPGEGASGPGSGTSGSGNDPANSQHTSPSSLNTTPTTPSSTDTAATKPSSVSPSSYTPGGLGDTGGPGGGETSSGAGGPGRSIPGTGSPVASQTVAAAQAARAGASTTGMAGMGGMGGMGAAGRGKGDSERETTHTLPEYLINAEHGEELIGELPKTVPGGVIGGDYSDGQSTDRE